MAFHPTRLVRLYTFICVICALLACLGAAPAQAATQTGTLSAGQYTYHDITLPNPQSGMRLVLSTGAASTIYLYTGSNHQAGSYLTVSSGKTLHTLLLAPSQLANGASYHVRIYAQSSTSYSFTDDLKFISGDLAWDDGSSLVGTSAISQPDTAGGDYLFKITGHAPSHPAWRNALKVTSGEANLYLQQGSAPLTGGTYSSAKVGSDVIYLDAGASLNGQDWYLRVNATPGSTWQLTSGDLFVQDLAWDDGSAPAGGNKLSQPSAEPGDYFFRITSRTSAYGAWRTVLNLTGGEAGFYMLQNSVPLGNTTYSSVNPGSDGVVLASGQFDDNQTWYIRVRSTVTSTWNIFSGDIHAHDLGSVSDSGASATVQVGPEGIYYFKASADANTQAWRLWLNGSSNRIYLSKGKAPVKTAWTESAEQAETGQALLVPPYLTSALYLVGVTGTPGSSLTLESRKQQILTPSAVSGYSQGGGAANFDFTLSGQGNSGGFGYLTYRIDVPVQQIAWQVNVTPGGASQNPEVYLRKGDVPNRWMNSAMSEAPAGVIDSITQAPPTLTDGAWYVTIYGSGDYTFSLTSKNPVITGATFINSSDPNPAPPGYAYPYQTVPLSNGAQFENQSGWRYYQVSDINSQVGLLGWQLDLANQAPNSEIALRRNAVPARWSYRNGGSSYSSGEQQAPPHLDLSSTTGLLQQPGHPADIWYIGVYSPNKALGAFQLTTRVIPAPPEEFSEGSVSVSDQSPTSWQWFKYTIPSDTALKGWDLRLKATAGSPQMVVRRDQLPESFTLAYNPSCGSGLYNCNTWASGFQWPATPGSDWTSRNYVTWAPSYTPDRNGYLIMGMGHPLEPGTYYVGVSRGGNSDATAMSYTLESRAIGLAGSSYPIKVQDLAYAGGTASASNLAPREVGWYRVMVPEGAGSWSLGMTPTQGEALIAVRRGALPNIAAWNPGESSAGNYAGAKRQKGGTEYFYKYGTDYEPAIPAGEYYLAVVSEGQSPASSNTIGTGNVSYTLTSVGAMPVEDKSSTPLAVGSVLSWSGQSLPYHAQKAYRVRVPAGLTSIEIRFKNKVGNPLIAIHQDDQAGPWKFPTLNPYHSEAANEGGTTSRLWQNYTYPKGFSNVVTIASPVAGDYTLVVRADLSGDNIATDAAYDLEVEALTPTPMLISTSAPLTGRLIDKQVSYYQVEVPAQVNGFDLAGWKINVATTTGAASLRVAKGTVPGGATPSLTSSAPATVVAPPYLSPGTWFIEVNGIGTTDYAITSEIISADREKHRRSWTMPDRDNQNASGTSFSYPAGLSAPEIGDSGLDAQGNPIINPNTGDQGTDLAQDDWHFYRIVVPENNGGHLKTVLEALSGTPELYLRAGGVPSPFHRADANNPNNYSAPPSYDRSQDVSGTMYGNWVPLDRRTALQLTPGDWWLGVKARGSNIRYRLKIAAGNVRAANAPVDSADPQSRLFQDLAQDGGSYTGQSLVAGNMRYYRVSIPQSATTGGTALAWTLTLQQQVGDVVLFLRDTVPPGQGADGDAIRNAAAYLVARSDLFQDWYDDNSSLEPNPYLVLDTPGSHTISLPPLRPGVTYYLGVIAKTDATFDISSAIGADRLKLDGIIPFADGSVSATIAGGERRLYRVDVPADALVWRHDALHDAGIRLYLTQGTLPSKGYYDHWYSNGQANSTLTRNLTGYPMQPGYPYYLLVENTTGSPLPFSLSMSGKDALSRLSVTVAGDCPGSKVTSSDVIDCSSGTCAVDLVPYSSIYLTARPGPGCGVTVTGACTSSGCVLDMAAATNVTATFTDVSAPYIATFSTPATAAVATVAVSFGATDNVAVTGYCLSESSSSAGCSWQATPPSSYTFSGIAANTPTGRYLYGHVKDAVGNINYSYAYVVVTITKARITVQVAGTGSGSVNSNPAGIACTAGSCSNDFGLGSAVTLLQSQSGGSLFAGWSGACTGTGACSVTVDAAKSVTATFNALPPVRIVGSTTVYYSTLQAAYNAAKSGEVIQLKEGTLAGSLIANRAIKVVLKGGFNAGYTSNSGGTTLTGRTTLRAGSVIFERVKVK